MAFQQGNKSIMQNEERILSDVIRLLKNLDGTVRERILKTICTFYDIDLKINGIPSANESRNIVHDSGRDFFTTERPTSPKEFLFLKKPKTDVERIACLAYYLTHFRETPQFKTIDLSKLNTEAAQLKFSNPAKAVDNATRTGLLVPTSKGNKQLSAIGEQYVLSLPDRVGARSALQEARPRKKAARQSLGRSKE